MHPLPWDLELSFRRVPLRALAVVQLAAVGETNSRALATSLGVETGRLNSIMHGDSRDYSVELSPVTLRLAEPFGRARRRGYRVTRAGREAAAVLRTRPTIRALLRHRAPPGIFV